MAFAIPVHVVAFGASLRRRVLKASTVTGKTRVRVAFLIINCRGFGASSRSPASTVSTVTDGAHQGRRPCSNRCRFWSQVSVVLVSCLRVVSCLVSCPLCVSYLCVVSSSCLHVVSSCGVSCSSVYDVSACRVWRRAITLRRILMSSCRRVRRVCVVLASSVVSVGFVPYPRVFMCCVFVLVSSSFRVGSSCLSCLCRVFVSCPPAVWLCFRIVYRSGRVRVMSLCRVRCCVVSSCHNYPRGVMSFLWLCVVSSCRIRSHRVVSSCTVSCLRLVSYLCVASSCLHVVSLSSCRVLVLSSCPVFVSNLPCQSFLVCIRVCGSYQAIAARLRLSSYASATASARTQHDHLLTIHT